MATCLIPGCGRTVIARGWCNRHYLRWKRHGDPLSGGSFMGLTASFLDKAVLYDGDECLLWPFARSGNGYGQIGIDGIVEYCHRIVCKRVHGDPPPDKPQTAHSCGNGHLGCISPRHLRWATLIENKADELLHGVRPRGETCGTSKLREDDVRAIRAALATTSRTLADIAAAFGVSSGAISHIKMKDTWVWLP